MQQKIRRDTSANWTAANPILGDGELGYDKTTGEVRIGNGTSRWATLKGFLKKTKAEWDALFTHTTDTNNPHAVSLATIGAQAALASDVVDYLDRMNYAVDITANGETSIAPYLTGSTRVVRITVVADSLLVLPPIGGYLELILEITNGGAWATTFSANVAFAGAVPPTLTADGKDVLVLYTLGGMAEGAWNGFLSAGDIR